MRSISTRLASMGICKCEVGTCERKKCAAIAAAPPPDPPPQGEGSGGMRRDARRGATTAPLRSRRAGRCPYRARHKRRVQTPQSFQSLPSTNGNSCIRITPATLRAGSIRNRCRECRLRRGCGAAAFRRGGDQEESPHFLTISGRDRHRWCTWAPSWSSCRW